MVQHAEVTGAEPFWVGVDLEVRPAGRRRHIPLAHRMWRPRPAGDLPYHTRGYGLSVQVDDAYFERRVDPARGSRHALLGHTDL